MSLRFQNPENLACLVTTNEAAPPQRLLSWQVHNFLLPQGCDYDGYGGCTWHYSLWQLLSLSNLMTTCRAPKTRSQLGALETLIHYAVYNLVACVGDGSRRLAIANIDCSPLHHESGYRPTDPYFLSALGFRPLILILFSIQRNL